MFQHSSTPLHMYVFNMYAHMCTYIILAYIIEGWVLCDGGRLADCFINTFNQHPITGRNSVNFHTIASFIYPQAADLHRKAEIHVVQSVKKVVNITYVYVC